MEFRDKNSMTRRSYDIPLLLALCGLTFFWRLGANGLFDLDEGLYVAAARGARRDALPLRGGGAGRLVLGRSWPRGSGAPGIPPLLGRLGAGTAGERPAGPAPAGRYHWLLPPLGRARAADGRRAADRAD